MSTEAERRAAVIAEARGWMDTRWQHLGRSKHGVDCVGLIVVVCAALELSDYDVKAYPREPKSSEFLSHFTNGGGTRIPMDRALPGDLLIFREKAFPCHVGILSAWDSGQATVIHAHARRRKVLEEPLIGDWFNNRVAAVRLPGIA